MNKSILIIDTPTVCDKCPCFQFGMDNYCAVTDETIYNYEKERSANCPLVQVPDKNYNGFLNDWEKGYKAGYNTCIDEVLGGKNI